MTTEFVTNYIDKKLNENDNFIRYTFYELRVKNNLSEEEVDEFLDLIIVDIILKIKGIKSILQMLDLLIKMQIEWYNQMNL